MKHDNVLKGLSVSLVDNEAFIEGGGAFFMFMSLSHDSVFLGSGNSAPALPSSSCTEVKAKKRSTEISRKSQSDGSSISLTKPCEAIHSQLGTEYRKLGGNESLDDDHASVSVRVAISKVPSLATISIPMFSSVLDTVSISYDFGSVLKQSNVNTADQGGNSSILASKSTSLPNSQLRRVSKPTTSPETTIPANLATTTQRCLEGECNNGANVSDEITWLTLKAKKNYTSRLQSSSEHLYFILQSSYILYPAMTFVLICTALVYKKIRQIRSRPSAKKER